MSVAAAVTPPVSTVAQQPIRVMIVDDAVVVRGLVSRWVDAEPRLPWFGGSGLPVLAGSVLS